MKKLLIALLLFTPLFASASIDTNLYYGVQNKSEVTELQEFLIDKGFLNHSSTGSFYSLTLSAVKAYQSSVGISSTGYVGTLTRKSINESLLADLKDSNDESVAETGSVPLPVTAPTSTITSTQPVSNNVQSNTDQTTRKECVNPQITISQDSFKVRKHDIANDDASKGDSYSWNILINSNGGNQSVTISGLTLVRDGGSDNDLPSAWSTHFSQKSLVNGQAIWLIGPNFYNPITISPNSSYLLSIDSSSENPNIGDTFRLGIKNILISNLCNPDSYIKVSPETLWSDYVTITQ